MTTDSAAHEARHAAMALLLAVPLKEASAHATEDSLGHVLMDLPSKWVRDLEPDLVRRLASVIAAGELGDDPDWPPEWPDADAQRLDERQLASIVAHLELDRDEWKALTKEMRQHARRPEFKNMERVLDALLETGLVLKARQLKDVGKTYLRGDDQMQHLTFKAATTVQTDQGVFEAVISTEAVDRERDVVMPEAMVDALRAWIYAGKMVPLAWNHSSAPEDQVGHINPSVKAVNGEVVASGWIDQDTERGAHVWRLAKSGTLGFSFGYMVTESTPREGGGRHITGLDVFEVSATPTPMNNGTRVLSTKAADNADMYENADPVMVGTGTNGHGEDKGIDARTAELVRAINGAFDTAAKASDADRAQRKSTTNPIRIKEFEC